MGLGPPRGARLSRGGQGPAPRPLPSPWGQSQPELGCGPGAPGGGAARPAEERGPRGGPARALLGTRSRAAVVARAERGTIAGSPPPADLSARYALILPGDPRPPGPQKAWLPLPVHGWAASHSGWGLKARAAQGSACSSGRCGRRDGAAPSLAVVDAGRVRRAGVFLLGSCTSLLARGTSKPFCPGRSHAG